MHTSIMHMSTLGVRAYATHPNCQSLDMEWRIWITRCIIFSISYSRLFWISLKKYETVAGNPSIRMYVNKIENRITFKVETRCYLELLTTEAMELLGGTENKITKD